MILPDHHQQLEALVQELGLELERLAGLASVAVAWVAAQVPLRLHAAQLVQLGHRLLQADDEGGERATKLQAASGWWERRS